MKYFLLTGLFLFNAYLIAENKVSESLLTTPSLVEFTAGVYQWELLYNYGVLRNKSLNEIEFKLEKHPKGMLLDRVAGLSWIPPKSAEGKNYDVLLQAEVDNKIVSTLDFKVKVVSTEHLSYSENNSIVDIKGSDCKAPSGKENDFSLLFLNKDIYPYDPKTATYTKSDYIDTDRLKLRKIVSDVSYDIPPEIEVMSCLFKMGNIKLAPIVTHHRILKNNFFIYFSDITPFRERVSLFRLTPALRATDYAPSPQPKSMWARAPSAEANGLYFVGRYKVK